MWNNLKASIAAVVRTNNNQEITGANLQNVLNTIVNSIGANATFAGVATPSTSPGTPDGPVFYITGQSGQYSNFGNQTVTVRTATLGIFLWNGSAWSYNPVIISGVTSAVAALSYAECSTQNSIAAKSVNIPGYELISGGSMKIKMRNANTAASNATLNISSTGAIPLYYEGELASASNSWEAGEVLDVYYDGTNYYANNVAGGSSSGVYDISAEHSGTAYADLAAALGTNGANVPAGKRKGGMSVMFINSITNQYEQWRLMAASWSTVVSDWQGVDDEPTAGSENLVKSSGIKSYIDKELYLDDVKEVNISELVSCGGTISNNTWLDSKKYYGALIPKSEFIKYTRLRITPATSNISAFAFTLNSFSAGEAVQYAEGYSGIITLNAGSPVMTYEIPANANYLFVALYADGERCPAKLEFVRQGGKSLKEEVVLLDRRMTSAELEIQYMEQYGFLKKPILFIGTIVNGSVNGSGYINLNGTYRASMRSTIGVPFTGAKIKFNLPTGVAVGVRHGEKPNAITTNNYWFLPGDEFTFPATSFYYQLSFAYETSRTGTGNTTPIDAADLNTALNNGTLSVEILNYDNHSDVIEDHKSIKDSVLATLLKVGTDRTQNLGFDQFPAFVHISDIHGDAYRFQRALRYINNLGHIDGIMISGDIVGETDANGLQYALDIIGDSIPAMVCVGNHEANGNTTDALKYTNVIKPFGDKYGYTMNTDKGYYYKDFVAKKIRVIGLNVYEGSATYQCSISQAQCDFLISTLLSTPSGFGVIIIQHMADTPITKDSNFAKFYQDVRMVIGGAINVVSQSIAAHPFSQIIDAFIGRTTASFTFGTVTVSADFTGVPAATEFICWVNGHQHMDTVGYLSSVQAKQLNLNIACAECQYFPASYAWGANQNDVPRGFFGPTQDLFNIFTIDRANGVVKIVRVGAHVNYTFQPRDVMIIPYKD